MKLSYGSLMFEEGDTLHVEDVFGKQDYHVRRGQNCDSCEFYAICNRNNPNNVFARFCKDTHFVLHK